MLGMKGIIPKECLFWNWIQGKPVKNNRYYTLDNLE